MKGLFSLLITSDAMPLRAPPRIERLGEVVCAVAPGDARDQSKKGAPFEDALVLLERADGARFGAVADAHFGPLSSGLLMRLFAEHVRSVRPDEEGLRAASVHAIRELAERLPASERSVTTFCAFADPGAEPASEEESALAWVSVGDSYVLRQEEGGLLRLRNTLRPYYVGAAARSYDRPPHPLSEAMESGSLRLGPGERLILSTDGIEPDESGLSWRDSGSLLAEGGSLEAGLRAFVAKACFEEEGGGGDNLALVMLAGRPR